VSQSLTPEQKEADEKKRAADAAEASEARRDVMIIMASIFAILFVISALMVSFISIYPPSSYSSSQLLQLGAAWMLGARFDLAFQDIKQGHLTPPKPSVEYHGEL
jgi:farnesyl-diphosphate farnesyltransferase